MIKLILIIALLFNGSSLAQTLIENKVKIIEELVIGKEENDQFVKIKAVGIDSEEKIFIAENSVIKIYDKNGKFVKNVGRDGKGPGEFLKIKSLYINQKDELYVFDFSALRILKFNNNHKFVNAQIIDLEKYRPNNFVNYKNDLCLLISAEYNRTDKPIIHIYSNKLDKKIESIPRQLIKLYEDEKLDQKTTESLSYSLDVIDENHFVYAKPIYNGIIYLFKKIEGEWKIDRELKGFNHANQLYLGFGKDAKRFDDENKVNFNFFNSTIGGYRINQYSYNLFVMNDKSIYHFVTYHTAKSIYYILEIHKEGKPLQCYLLSKKESPNQSGWGLSPDYLVSTKDKNDKFYLVDITNDYQILKRVTFQILN